jgi:hypothetical protein
MHEDVEVVHICSAGGGCDWGAGTEGCEFEEEDELSCLFGYFGKYGHCCNKLRGLIKQGREIRVEFLELKTRRCVVDKVKMEDEGL